MCLHSKFGLTHQLVQKVSSASFQTESSLFCRLVASNSCRIILQDDERKRCSTWPCKWKAWRSLCVGSSSCTIIIDLQMATGSATQRQASRSLRIEHKDYTARRMSAYLFCCRTPWSHNLHNHSSLANGCAGTPTLVSARLSSRTGHKRIVMFISDSRWHQGILRTCLGSLSCRAMMGSQAFGG